MSLPQCGSVSFVLVQAVVNRLERDRPLVEAVSALAHSKPGLGFWKLFRRLRRQGTVGTISGYGEYIVYSNSTGGAV